MWSWLRERSLTATTLCVAVVGFAALASSPARAADVTVSVDTAAVSELTERYRVDVGEDGVELTPIERDGAVESIELLDGEDEALVNGKSFTRAELEAFLGADGRAIAALLDLSSAARRTRLGHAPAEPEAADADSNRRRDSSFPEPPEPPDAPEVFIHTDGDDRVSFGQSITIEAGESTGEAVCIGCSIRIEGSTRGDVVAVGGRVEVDSGGRIGGNAVSVGARVDVASGAVVEGDAVAVGGRVHIDDGGVVEGQRSSVGWGASWFGGPTSGFLPHFASDFSDLFWTILRTALLVLLAAIAMLFVRGPVERTSRRLTDEPWKAVLTGLLTQLLFFPVLVLVTVILAVSVIGIPLLVLVPVAILAFVVAMLIGYVAVSLALGRWARERFGWNLPEPFVVVVAGVVLLQATTIAARFLGMFGTIGGMIGFALLCLGFFLKYVGWTIGLGGMVMSLRARDWRRPVPSPAPPPLAPIDFTRDDPPSVVPQPPSTPEISTETVTEDELRARDERND